ncbi:MAG: hypothetical protein R3229_03190 [Alphaproteobacteria bacterium]|nr:hypothetical protein [Alphaproteobacteria bacterium]
MHKVILERVSRHRFTAAAAAGFVLTAAIVWTAAAPDHAPTHYVVRWKATGLCTVVRERPPERQKYATMWFTTLKHVAQKKAKEFKENGRCARIPQERRTLRPVY